MKRTLMQTYVRGSKEAVESYKEAFHAELGYHVMNDDGTTYYHAELDVYGQVLAVSERPPEAGETTPGNTMQFCLHFGEDEEALVHHAFGVLSKDAVVFTPPGKCDFSNCMTDFIDRFGVRWCLFN